MVVIEMIFLALALALDAFAVSLCLGCSGTQLSIKQYMRIAFTFGIFQGLMPVLGWAMGLTVQQYIVSWDHWVAFALLVWIGFGMLKSGLSSKGEGVCCVLQNKRLFVLAVATSIDAFAVGLSFALLQKTIWLSALVIGVCCAILTACGLSLGQRFVKATHLGKKAEVLGGIVLILIGCNILYEHGVF